MKRTKRTIRRACRLGRSAAIAWLLGGVTLLVSCAPQSERERELLLQRKSQKAESEILQLTVAESALDTDVIRMVKDSPAPDGGTNTEAWVNKQMDGSGMQAIFPRWEVSRRGATKYEARYIFTQIGDGDEVSKRGWKWDVDVSLRVVGEARPILPQDQAARPQQSESQQQKRRIDLEEASLE